MSNIQGFRTKGRGKNRRVYPVYKGYKGFHKGQMTISSVIAAQEMRSPMAKKIDAQRRASIATEEEWINEPNRHDYPGIDTPKGSSEPPVLTKEKMAEMHKQGEQSRKEEEASIKEMNSHIITGHETYLPTEVQCPNDNHVFEPVVQEGFSYGDLKDDSRKIWCDKCGRTYTYNEHTEKWSTSDGSLKVLKGKAKAQGIEPESIVKKALDEGRYVPPELLAQYPHLQKKKEPWEMTYSEFFDHAGSEYTARDRFKLDYQGENVPMRLGDIEDGKTRWVGELGATPEERIHRSVIRQAILEGKTVPKEVLDQYPDLKPLTTREYLSVKLGGYPHQRIEIEKTPNGYVKIIKNPENQTIIKPLTDAEAVEQIEKIKRLSGVNTKVYGNLKAPILKGSVEGSTATYNKATGWMALSFSSIPAPEVRAEMKQNGFRYNPVRKQWVGKWYPYREELAKKFAGSVEQVDIKPNWAAKAEHAANMAVKHEQASDEIYARKQKLQGMMSDEPIHVGHHSERHHRADIERLGNLLNKTIEEHKIAEKYADRAERYGQLATGESPHKIYRRIQKLEADKRKMERNKAEAVQKKAPNSIEWADKWLNEYNTRLTVEREKYKAAGGLPIEKLSLQNGNRVKTTWGLGTVVKVNDKTVKVKLDNDKPTYGTNWYNRNLRKDEIINLA